MNDTIKALLALAGVIGIATLMVFLPWDKLLMQPAETSTVQQRSSTDIFETRLLNDDTFLGDPEAPILIAEFGEFMCPFCGEIKREIEPLWREEYLDTGKARYVFRDFISLNHQQAFIAAQANECADEQDTQWKMYDILYENVYDGDVWSKIPDAKGVVEAMKKYAEQIGLDMQKFETCMNDTAMVNEVKKDLIAGLQMGVTGTPTIYIGNDKTGFSKVLGGQPYSVYKQIIDEKLKE